MLPYKDYSGMQLPGIFLGKKSEKTFQYDDSLPPLPVPPLEHSLYRYLDSVRPLVSEEEFKKTEALVKQFAAGIGKDLHEKLLEKAKHSKNWLEEWWEKYAYLSTRTPHAPYMTMTGPGSYNRDIWQAKEGTQIERISLLTWLGAVYWNILRREQLAIDRGSKTVVWSMNQYQRIFNSCKIPQPNIDALKLYFKTEAQGPCPSHVIVLVNGHIYMLDTLDANNQPYTPPMFERAFTQIKQAAYSGNAGPGLGSLTAMAREPWFKLREHLIELHPDNGKLLELLQSAVYCISLDDRSPATLDEAVRWATMDDCTNRWFDKSYALIIYRNGLISSACDHTGYEAMPKQMFAFWGANVMALNDYRWMGSSDASKIPAFQELKFVVDNKIHAGIREAKAVFQENGAKIDVLYHEFKEYGKEWLRKFKLHPDTFMQMALQLTYYRLYGRGAPTYETAVTRQFYHGRTETLRVCTSESMSMCRAMQDSWASAKVKKEKLMFAMDKHLRLMQEAMNNSGCDRHLMGLQLIAMEEGLPRPALFSDPSWVKSGGDGNFILSTSFLGFLPATGLVPAMCDNGYGFFYSIIDSQMQFFCTSYIDGKAKKSRQFVDAMCQSLRDLRRVLEEAAVPSKM